MIRFTRWFLVGAIVLQPALLSAQGIREAGTAAQAQGATAGAPAPLGPVLTVSPTWRPVVVELPGEQVTSAVAQGADRRNVAWMAVGAAALMVGMLIGGDAGTVIAVSGGVIGLVGLFRYMQ